MAFVTFEGPEGSGKSTQIALLAEAIREQRECVVITREPGGTVLGEKIRTMLLDVETSLAPETEAYLMTAARAEHVREIIRPALERGAVVLCDRFVDSTLAYQGAGRGISFADLRTLQNLATDDLVPDLTLLFDLPVASGLARKQGSDIFNRLDREDVAFHERVADWYRHAAINEPGRWRIVDATGNVRQVCQLVVREWQLYVERSNEPVIGGESL